VRPSIMGVCRPNSVPKPPQSDGTSRVRRRGVGQRGGTLVERGGRRRLTPAAPPIGTLRMQPCSSFFSVEVLTRTGLVRYFVMVVIDLKSRRVHLAGVVHDLHEAA
jgi:hypothetical protein